MFWHSEQNQCGTSSNLLLPHFSGPFFTPTKASEKQSRAMTQRGLQ